MTSRGRGRPRAFDRDAAAAPGARRLLGARLRGHLARRPHAGDGDRRPQPLRRLRLQGSSCSARPSSCTAGSTARSPPARWSRSRRRAPRSSGCCARTRAYVRAGQPSGCMIVLAATNVTPSNQADPRLPRRAAAQQPRADPRAGSSAASPTATCRRTRTRRPSPASWRPVMHGLSFEAPRRPSRRLRWRRPSTRAMSRLGRARSDTATRPRSRLRHHRETMSDDIHDPRREAVAAATPRADGRRRLRRGARRPARDRRVGRPRRRLRDRLHARQARADRGRDRRGRDQRRDGRRAAGAQTDGPVRALGPARDRDLGLHRQPHRQGGGLLPPRACC